LLSREAILPRDEGGQLDTKERIVDAVVAEDIAETAGNDARNLSCSDGGRSLLSGQSPGSVSNDSPQEDYKR
jgi:hypothetical protein